jgi:hypothetical protein
MVSVGNVNNIGERWSRRASGAQQDYQTGVEQTDESWSQETSEATASWEQGVQEAASEGRFGDGVQDAGDEKWRRKTLSLGPSRYATGVRESQSEYEEGFAPYVQVLEGISLSPRGPRGDIDANIERVREVASALHNARVNR